VNVSWPLADLSDYQHQVIACSEWKCMPIDNVVLFVRGWNAGVDTLIMAPDLGVTPGQLRILVGKCKQLGIEMRRATPKPKVRKPPGSAPARRLAAEIEGDLSRFEGGASLSGITDWFGSSPALTSSAIALLIRENRVRIVAAGVESGAIAADNPSTGLAQANGGRTVSA